LDGHEPWLRDGAPEHELEGRHVLLVRCEPVRLPIYTALPIARGSGVSVQSDGSSVKDTQRQAESNRYQPQSQEHPFGWSHEDMVKQRAGASHGSK
jgi:hypothetical protein